MKYSAIILAAGSGVRTGLNLNKIMYQINGRKVVNYSLDFFLSHANCAEIILVVSKADYSIMNEEYKSLVNHVIIGGNSRQESVYNALKIAVNDFVLVHDAARPFINLNTISNICDKLEHYSSITLGVKVKDTIQKIDGDTVVETFDRSTLIITQTPQGFEKTTLLKAHKLALKDGYIGTDDTILMEKYLGIHAYVVEGDYRNIKLTTIEDIKLLEVILKWE